MDHDQHPTEVGCQRTSGQRFQVPIGVLMLVAFTTLVSWLAFRIPPSTNFRAIAFTQETGKSGFTASLLELNRLIGQPADRATQLGPSEKARANPGQLEDRRRLLRWARRAALGLIGHIPAYEELQWLLTLDQESAQEIWVDYLFSDRRHADYLAERLARAWVGTDHTPILVFRRRRFVSWLSDQILENRPYDQIVQELVTAEGVWTSSPQVNFLTSMIDDESGGNPNPKRLAGRVTRAFLGVRLDCMECHDDNLNGRWEQRDFHQLAAFFAPASATLTGIRDQERPYQFTYLHREQSELVTARVPFHPELYEELEALADLSSREKLARWMANPKNRPFARVAVNRTWTLLVGRPFVEPVDDIPLDVDEPPVFRYLIDDFIANQFDMRRLMRLIVLSHTFNAATGHGVSTPAELAADWSRFPTSRLRPDQIAGSILQASRLKPVTLDSPALVRLVSFGAMNDFLEAFGDPGADELAAANIQETLPRRLFMLNGKSVKERTTPDLVTNACSQIAEFLPDDEVALQKLFLITLTRAPTPEEQFTFSHQMRGLSGSARQEAFADLAWVLMNSSEFTTNR